MGPVILVLFVGVLVFSTSAYPEIAVAVAFLELLVIVRALMVAVELGDSICIRNAYRTTRLEASRVARFHPAKVALGGVGSGGCLAIEDSSGATYRIDATIGSGYRGSGRAFAGTTRRFEHVAGWARSRGIKVEGSPDDTVG